MPHIVIGPSDAGYIRKEKLERQLLLIFREVIVVQVRILNLCLGSVRILGHEPKP
jgi:hypothetical protein